MIKGENQSGQIKRRPGVKLIHKIQATHFCTLHIEGHNDVCRLPEKEVARPSDEKRRGGSLSPQTPRGPL